MGGWDVHRADERKGLRGGGSCCSVSSAALFLDCLCNVSAPSQLRALLPRSYQIVPLLWLPRLVSYRSSSTLLLPWDVPPLGA